MTRKARRRAWTIAYVKAGWHKAIVDTAHKGFCDALSRMPETSAAVETFDVPGSFDIPLLTKKLALTRRYDAIVASGFVVDGGIYRHDFVAGTVIDALMQVQLRTDVPVISAVLTAHNYQENEHFDAFFTNHFRIKGEEAACACVAILDNLDRVSMPAPRAGAM